MCWGGQIQVGEYWGSMELGRTDNAHQLAGAPSSLACYRSLYTREDKYEYLYLSGQPVGGSIYKTTGGTRSNSLSLLAVQFWQWAFEQGDCPEGQTSTRY